jgi:hypothetical protein
MLPLLPQPQLQTLLLPPTQLPMLLSRTRLSDLVMGTKPYLL